MGFFETYTCLQSAVFRKVVVLCNTSVSWKFWEILRATNTWNTSVHHICGTNSYCIILAKCWWSRTAKTEVQTMAKWRQFFSVYIVITKMIKKENMKIQEFYDIVRSKTTVFIWTMSYIMNHVFIQEIRTN